jgi:SpoVK/Ycf46/Vps4 family AAA+-type ATPase
MLFTGNPGSAKTTCARLLAGILKEQGFLQTGAFVECGRGDLVGKYVGWTAKIVKEKFSQARGGILFIDEAYALNSDDHFGPEAINTAVQEMENHRDDVVVIFAGYPEPMEKFLRANEGLRSRIAFHLEFPDYNADEMTDIFNLMLEEQGYICETEALEKARNLFSAATAQKEFGNGRFARNLLEQSIMKQSARLAGFADCTEAGAAANRPLHRQDLITLLAEDIAVETVQNHRQDKPLIGF